MGACWLGVQYNLGPDNDGIDETKVRKGNAVTFGIRDVVNKLE